jgi:NADH-quinone oxidoreductase subunit J
LFLFVVTLLTAGKEEGETADALSGQRLAGVIAGLAIGLGLAVVVAEHPAPKVAAAKLGNLGTLHSVGQQLWGPDFLMLMAVALMLLTAAMGVLVLNRPENRRPPGTRSLPQGVSLSEAGQEGER